MQACTRCRARSAAVLSATAVAALRAEGDADFLIRALAAGAPAGPEVLGPAAELPLVETWGITRFGFR